MKAIILAAGEGSRLRPLTNTTPKPLLKILGKTILEYNFEAIYQHVSEIIVVVKYKKELFPKALGDNYKGVPISYHEQRDIPGTAAALIGIEHGGEDIIIMSGDSIFHEDDIYSVVKSKGYALLVKEVKDPSKYGICKNDSNGYLFEIIEKPKKDVGNLASLGVYKLSGKIFEYVKKIEKSSRGEYDLPDAINMLAKDIAIKTLSVQKSFLDITYSWNLLSATKHYLDRLKKSEIKGEIEDKVTIKGNIILEKGAVLKSGTYIEGNCYIAAGATLGPNCYIRGDSSFGKNSHVGNAVEIKNSYLGENTKCGHLSYIGDSVLGNNINIGAGFKVANLRHDGTNIKVPVKGEMMDTGVRKLGCIIGDHTKTGINTLMYPGRVLDSETYTMPGEIVR